MSYILKALKRAQESREGPRAPTVVIARRPGGYTARRLPWRWIISAALLLNTAALILVVVVPYLNSRPTADHIVGPPPPGPVVTATPSSPAPVVAATPPPTPPSEPAPTVAKEPPPAAPPKPPARVAPTPVPPKESPAPPRAPVARAQPAPVIPKTAPPARVEPSQEPVRIDMPKPVPSAPATATTPPPTVFPPQLTPPASAPRPPAPEPIPSQRAAPRPAAPATTTAVVSPATTPSKPSLSPELRDAVEKIKLEVLVWAEDPKDRMVFINGHKYTEGQTIDGKVVIERIAEDSIVLVYQGQRVRLSRP